MRRRLAVLTAALGLLGGLPALAVGTSDEDLTALVNPLAGSLGPGFVTVGAGVPVDFPRNVVGAAIEGGAGFCEAGDREALAFQPPAGPPASVA